ncbi:MAG: Ig-like domain-containing protein [Oscillospiraceae bacterium]|nr:Ig-like domain-containing protein [Oscillospiraceae bacterium]MBO5638834.1 Ig-like domain-containing protein [Oscillospiraceae bacterium]
MKQGKRILALCLVLILAAALLAGCGKKAAYEVVVNDAAGKPVPGVTIQFCSDAECIMGTTDDKGVAVFDKEAGSYTIHVLKVPAGFAADDTEYPAPAQPGQVTIVLK